MGTDETEERWQASLETAELDEQQATDENRSTAAATCEESAGQCSFQEPHGPGLEDQRLLQVCLR